MKEIMMAAEDRTEGGTLSHAAPFSCVTVLLRELCDTSYPFRTKSYPDALLKWFLALNMRILSQLSCVYFKPTSDSTGLHIGLFCWWAESMDVCTASSISGAGHLA